MPIRKPRRCRNQVPAPIQHLLLPSGRRQGYSLDMTPGVKRTAWVLNTLGFILYLAWLTTLDARQTLRSQDGILFYLPCIPFLFVYLLLVNPKPGPKGKPWWQSDEDYAREQREKQIAPATPPENSSASKP